MSDDAGNDAGLELRVRQHIAAAPDRVFMALAHGLDTWWPREFSWSGGSLVGIAMEPWLNGHCYEVGPGGFRCDWGRVITWDPPMRVRFSWQIGADRTPLPDSRQATEVDIGCSPDMEGGTFVKLVHEGFEVHGSHGDDYREAMRSAWVRALADLAASVEGTPWR